MTSEKRTTRLNQKVMESDDGGSTNIIGNGHMIPGLKMASKVFTIIYGAKLGKPYVLPISGVGAP